LEGPYTPRLSCLICWGWVVWGLDKKTQLPGHDGFIALRRRSRVSHLCLSLGDLSLVNPVPKGHCLVVLESYFDGAYGPNRDNITLATACGTSEQWNVFTSEWREVLGKHEAEFLHTTDAVSLQNEFHPDNGWSRDSVDALISDCVEVIAKHLSLPGPFREISRPGLHVVTLTIPLNDYRKARKVVAKLPNSITELCTSESLGFCFNWGRRIGAQFYHLYFDQGEPFYGHAHDRKVGKKSKKAITLMKDVVHLGQSNMRVVPALQLADLFAWCITHNDAVTRKWHERLHDIPWDSLYLDYGYLVNPTPGALERTADWNLPQRKVYPGDEPSTES
jgi:hypothetical protein